MKLLGFFEGKPYFIYAPEELIYKCPKEPMEFWEIPRYATDQRKEAKNADKNV